MAFLHTPVSAHPSLIVSYCKKCRSLVAASPNPSVLKSAEQAHQCEDGADKSVRSRKKQVLAEN